ncbi:MAG: sigma-70 family RNA polymerase sigma factor [Candidatus Eisenbacteria bacterium]
MTDRDEVTRLLQEVSDGQPAAASALLPLVYDELRRLAQHYLGQERPDHTLQATALVHEAYLKLIDQSRAQWIDRAHFFTVAAQAMRRILVDHARRKKRQRHGGGRVAVDLTEAVEIPADGLPAVDLVALDRALSRLAEHAPEKARVVEVRFFAGLPVEEIAEVLGVTTRTVRRYWQYAQAWLYREMEEADAEP